MSLLVVRVAAQTLVQDAGRWEYAHLGVPTSGAFDGHAWRLANRLVGNHEGTAALEVLGGGLALTAQRHHTLAVCGALGEVRVDARTRSTHEPLLLAPGQQLTVGNPVAGVRYYVAVSGGLALPEVLGSQSTDTLGRLGPQVRAGDILPVGPWRGQPLVDLAPRRREATVFMVTRGPDLDIEPLLEATWDLDPQSNRIGVRLTGIPIPAPQASLPSKPMVRGAVQLPPNGLPIILGPDHPTTGGYPVIAVVTPASMDDVAQWSGGPRRFRLAQ